VKEKIPPYGLADGIIKGLNKYKKEYEHNTMLETYL
jgi:hypothetical protein